MTVRGWEVAKVGFSGEGGAAVREHVIGASCIRTGADPPPVPQKATFITFQPSSSSLIVLYPSEKVWSVMHPEKNANSLS